MSDKPIATTSLRIVVLHEAKLRRLNHVTYESLPEDRTDGQQHKSIPKLEANKGSVEEGMVHMSVYHRAAAWTHILHQKGTYACTTRRLLRVSNRATLKGLLQDPDKDNEEPNTTRRGSHEKRARALQWPIRAPHAR